MHGYNMIPGGLVDSESEVVSPPTKLDLLVEQLQSDRRVFLPGEPIFNGPSAGWAETVTIVSGSINPLLGRDGVELNEFMDSLCPKGIDISARDATRGWSIDQQLEVPKLYFDEPIGKRFIRQSIDLQGIDMQALQRLGLNPGNDQKVWEEVLRRRTWLYVYPHIELADMAYQQMTGRAQLANNLAFRIPSEIMMKLDERKGSRITRGIKSIISR